MRFGSVLDKDSLRKVAFKDKVDVVVSCLASRTGAQRGSPRSGTLGMLHPPSAPTRPASMGLRLGAGSLGPGVAAGAERLSSRAAPCHAVHVRPVGAGGKKDSWLIDYEATKKCLDVGREMGMQHFVLLSAICVQKPLLEFQRAKLKLEEDLQVRWPPYTHVTASTSTSTISWWTAANRGLAWLRGSRGTRLTRRRQQLEGVAAHSARTDARR